MGLRLYNAPVESDIQSKPASEKRPAQQRSTIRRLARPSSPWRSTSRYPHEPILTGRARAANVLGELIREHDRAREDRERSRPTAPLAAPAPPIAEADLPDSNRRRLMPSHIGILDDGALTIFGERWAHLHAESNPAPSRDEEIDRRRRSSRAADTYATSSLRSTQARASPGFRSVRVDRATGTVDSTRTRPPPVPPRQGSGSGQTWRGLLQRYEESESAPFDGLGDRNRSLSPEGDSVWDTLQSTVTPDPQPPSVGSSFASTSALTSASVSQSAAAASSRTSFTYPDMAGDSGLEPPCESGCENDSDTEGDDDDEFPDTWPRFPSAFHLARRSYADVTRSSGSSSDDPLELLGGVASIQRFISNLARRENIPDEWWAEAGLSRTLAREGSSS